MNSKKKKSIKNVKISRRRVRGSFQYEGPQVPQVTYREGREGNVFISECLFCLVCEEKAKIILELIKVKHLLNADQNFIECVHKGIKLWYNDLVRNYSGQGSCCTSHAQPPTIDWMLAKVNLNFLM